MAAEPRAITARHVEIAALIAEGCTNREIERRLTLTAGTVAEHVEQIIVRLGVHSRAHAAAWYLRTCGRPRPPSPN